MPNDQNEKPQEIEIPLEWHVPESVVSHYVTNLVVQRTEHEFIISFFVTKPPLIIGQPKQEALENIKSITAECVTQVIVARDRMPAFVKALQTNLERPLPATALKEELKEQ